MAAKEDIREQERERIRRLIRSEFQAELGACRDLHAVVIDVVERHTPELSAPLGTAAGPAVMFLFCKAWRSFSAACILAREGHGPDAMVVARSLVNATIDLGYIAMTGEDCEDRAWQWSAVGLKAQRDYLQQFGMAPEGTQDCNWPKIEAQVKCWRDLKIIGRAKHAGLEDLYKIAYAAGSSPEHSDSWSSIDYIEENTQGGLSFQVGPCEKGVARALSAACWGLSEAFIRWCRFFELDEDRAMRRVVEIGHQFSHPTQTRGDGTGQS